MKQRPLQNLVRHTFKVKLPDGTTVELERWAPTREEALPHVRAHIALNLHGAKLIGDAK
jgi:hypothetical protein